MIAGLVLTYTRAFRLGDRVKIGDTFGDIVETSLLATHVQTIKNEMVVIPNGLVLGGSVTNYTRASRTLGLILHTSVTIGYDAPWRTIHGLLIEAAHATPGLLKEPAPFVWQTALNDFYVTYEINAYTDRHATCRTSTPPCTRGFRTRSSRPASRSCRRISRRFAMATGWRCLSRSGQRDTVRRRSGWRPCRRARPNPDLNAHLSVSTSNSQLLSSSGFGSACGCGTLGLSALEAVS